MSLSTNFSGAKLRERREDDELPWGLIQNSTLDALEIDQDALVFSHVVCWICS